MSRENEAANEASPPARPNVAVVGKENSKLSGLKPRRFNSTRRKKKFSQNTAGSGVMTNNSRHSDRYQDFFDLDSAEGSLYSLALSTFDLVSIHEDDFSYEESLIKTDKFSDTYKNIVKHKRGKSFTTQSTVNCLDKEIGLFKNIASVVPYELSHLSTKISPDVIANIRKTVDRLKLSTSLCILTYIYRQSNVHLKGHFPLVYVYRSAAEPPNYPVSEQSDKQKELLAMDATCFTFSEHNLMGDDSESSSKGSSTTSLSKDAPALQRSQQIALTKTARGLSEYTEKLLTDKYVFRFGLRNNSIKYTYINIKPYYPPNMSQGQQFKIDIIGLRGIHLNEPYFATICFVDVKLKHKISEDFFFNFNDRETNDLLDDIMMSYAEKDVKNRVDSSKTAILNSIFSSVDDIYMVLRVQTLKRALKKKEFRAIYNTPDKKKNKRNKEDIIVRLLQRPLLTHCMGWYAYSLKACLQNQSDSRKDTNGNPSNAKDTSTINLIREEVSEGSKDIPCILSSVECFQDKQDRFSVEDIIELLLEHHRNGCFKKLNTLAVEFKFSVTKLSSNTNCNLVYNWITMDQAYKNANTSLPVAITLLELYPNNCMVPIKTFQNIALLELKNLNLVNQRSFLFKHVLCKIELIDGTDLKPIKCFYSKFNRLELQTEYFTSLNTSLKSIHYKETVKVELPFDAHPNTHFLFSFYGVSFDKNHDEKLQISLLTWLPLFADKTLNIGKHSLPLALGGFAQGYEFLAPTLTSSTKYAQWIDGQKPLFTVKLMSYSSVVPSNKFVFNVLEGDSTQFFDDLGNCTYFKNVCAGYSDKSQLNIVSCLYPLLHKVMSYFFTDADQIANTFHQITANKFSSNRNEMHPDQKIYRSLLDNVFTALILLLNSAFMQLEPFNDANGRSPLLGIYSNFMFNPKHLVDFNMKAFFLSLENAVVNQATITKNNYNLKIRDGVENFLKCWISLKTQLFEKSTLYTWFLLELVNKMILFLYETTSTNPKVTTANGKTIQLRDPKDDSSKVAFSEEFYAYLVRLGMRLGHSAFVSLSNDKNKHDIIGSAWCHFIIQILQSVEPFIVRIMIKVFFDEITIVEDGQINQMIVEYKLNILNILMGDERIAAVDVFMLAAESKSLAVDNENMLIEFLYKSTPILNVFLAEVMHSLHKEPDLAKKTFDLVFSYVLCLCEGKSPIGPIADNSNMWKSMLLNNPVNKPQRAMSSPVQLDRSTMHTSISLSLYPLALYIIEFFGREYRLQLSLTTDSAKTNIDFSSTHPSNGFSYEHVQSMITKNVSTFGNTYMTNLCLLFIWILSGLDKTYLLNCLNEWNASKSFEFGVTLYSCLLVFQVAKSERIKSDNNAASVDSPFRKFTDSQGAFKGTDLRDGSLTKSNALTLLKKRRMKRLKTTAWSTSTEEEDLKCDANSAIYYKKDNIIAECSSFIVHIIDIILHASIVATIRNGEVVHKCLLVLIQTLLCREPIFLKLDVIYLSQKFFSVVPLWLFGKDYSIINELFKALIHLFCSNSPQIRRRAIEYCYEVFVLNISVHQNINAATENLHMVVSSISLNNNESFENIFQSINTLKGLSTKGKSPMSQIHSTEFENCVGFSLAILTNRSKINYLHKCGCTISVIQIICDIIEQCPESVDLRLYWIYTLLQIVSLDEQYANAAMCCLHIAVSCFEQLKAYGEIERLKSMDWTYFKVLSSNLGLEVTAAPRDTTVFNTEFKSFTPLTIITLMQQAAQQLKQARSTLLAYQTYSLANDFCFKFGFYNEIMSISANMNECLKSICEGYYGTSTYFRIGFYGEPFESICSYPEYILHYTRIIPLSELCNNLNQIWVNVLSGRKLNIINSPHDVNKDELKKDECYIQVTTVEPFHVSGDVETSNDYEKHNNISKFYYKTPYVMNESKKFVKSSSVELSLKNQSSRMTIIHTRYSLPYVAPLVPILKKDHSFLTPIEVSIEDLKKRSDDLHTICAMSHPNMVLLEGLLQGCVSASVNQGPLAIAETFLQPQASAPNYDKNCLKLINIFKTLLNNSKNALKTFRNHSDSSRIGLCDHMEANYKQLKTQLLKYIPQ